MNRDLNRTTEQHVMRITKVGFGAAVVLFAVVLASAKPPPGRGGGGGGPGGEGGALYAATFSGDAEGAMTLTDVSQNKNQVRLEGLGSIWFVLGRFVCAKASFCRLVSTWMLVRAIASMGWLGSSVFFVALLVVRLLLLLWCCRLCCLIRFPLSGMCCGLGLSGGVNS